MKNLTKLHLLALGTVMPISDSTAEALDAILEYVPNKHAAVEMLCGLLELPKLLPNWTDGVKEQRELIAIHPLADPDRIVEYEESVIHKDRIVFLSASLAKEVDAVEVDPSSYLPAHKIGKLIKRNYNGSKNTYYPEERTITFIETTNGRTCSIAEWEKNQVDPGSHQG